MVYSNANFSNCGLILIDLFSTFHRFMFITHRCDLLISMVKHMMKYIMNYFIEAQRCIPMLSQHISPLCHIYASVNQASIASDNGLVPIQSQAII